MFCVYLYKIYVSLLIYNFTKIIYLSNFLNIIEFLLYVVVM